MKYNFDVENKAKSETLNNGNGGTVTTDYRSNMHIDNTTRDQYSDFLGLVDTLTSAVNRAINVDSSKKGIDKFSGEFINYLKMQLGESKNALNNAINNTDTLKKLLASFTNKITDLNQGYGNTRNSDNAIISDSYRACLIKLTSSNHRTYYAISSIDNKYSTNILGRTIRLIHAGEVIPQDVKQTINKIGSPTTKNRGFVTEIKIGGDYPTFKQVYKYLIIARIKDALQKPDYNGTWILHKKDADDFEINPNKIPEVHRQSVQECLDIIKSLSETKNKYKTFASNWVKNSDKETQVSTNISVDSALVTIRDTLTDPADYQAVFAGIYNNIFNDNLSKNLERLFDRLDFFKDNLNDVYNALNKAISFKGLIKFINVGYALFVKPRKDKDNKYTDYKNRFNTGDKNNPQFNIKKYRQTPIAKHIALAKHFESMFVDNDMSGYTLKETSFSMKNIMKRIARINNFACTGKWRCPECGAEMKGDDCKSCGYSCK